MENFTFSNVNIRNFQKTIDKLSKQAYNVSNKSLWRSNYVY